MSELDETTRRKYLEEMGITVWSSRALQTGVESVGATAEKAVPDPVQKPIQVPGGSNVAVDSANISLPEPLPMKAFADDFSSLPAEMDIPSDTGLPTSSPASIPPGGDTGEGLLDEINHCECCHLCKTRQVPRHE